MSKTLVLCVDDDAGSLEIRKLLLQSVGYETLCATDGSSALQLFATTDVQIVVLDYAMPDLNGSEVARRMRALNPQIPIVMLSGQLVRPADVDGEVDAFIRKGGDASELIEWLECLLSRKKTRSERGNEPKMGKLA